MTTQPIWAPGVFDIIALRGKPVRLIYKESARSRKWKRSSATWLEYGPYVAQSCLAVARQNGWHAVSVVEE